MQNIKKYYECVIIGAGCAGCSAAIYLGMSNMDCVIIGGYQPGGVITTTRVVENYPGLPNIDGNDLAKKFTDHASKYCDIIHNNVSKIGLNSKTDIKQIHLDNGIIVECKYIIICSGSSYKKMEQLQDNVNYCAFCDGFLYKDKDVVVFGGGNSAFEAASYLSGICKSVTIIHRTSLFKAFPSLRFSVEKKKNVRILTNRETKSYENNIIKFKNERHEDVECDGAFVCIGVIPNTSFLPDEIQLDMNGYIVVNNKMATSVNGIYAAGDVTKSHPYCQITTAAASGTVAALACVEEKTRRN